MRYRLSLLIIAVALSGCAGPQKVITFEVQDDASPLMIVDKRPQSERNHLGGCSSHGRAWYTVPESAFDPARMVLLRQRLSSGLGERLKSVTVKHFQNCYVIRSASGAAALAGISYILALAVDAAHKPDDDVTMTYIVLEVDGKEVAAADIRPFKQGAVISRSYERKETADIMAQSTEAAITKIIAKLKQLVALTNQ